jgi:predicted acyltransferase
MYLRTQRRLKTKVISVATAGTATVLLGLLWNLSFPINKKLWTSSYVLFAGGLGLLLIALCLLLVDLLRKDSALSKQSRFTSFLVFGTNAIAAYVFSELLQSIFGSIHLGKHLNLQQFLYQLIHQGVPDPAFASLLYSAAFVLICWIFVYYVLYRREIFLKV